MVTQVFHALDNFL